MNLPPESWAIRNATRTDLPYLEPHLWPQLLAEPRRRRFLRGLDDGEVSIVFGSGGPHELGCYAWIYEGFFGHTFLAYLGVVEAHRRRGLAGLMLAETERRAVTDRVFSSTNASNAAMQAVFQRYGWTQCGTIDELDPGDPELVYVKRVGDPPQIA